jgi:hypothetical protein
LKSVMARMEAWKLPSTRTDVAVFDAKLDAVHWADSRIGSRTYMLTKIRVHKPLVQTEV